MIMVATLTGFRRFLFAGVVGLVASFPVLAGIDDGLIAYYSFDGERPELDCSGQGRDAAVDGSPSLVPGKKGDGLDFGGKSFFTIESLANFAWGEQLTVSCWFRYPEGRPSSGLLMNAGSLENPSWQMSVLLTDYGVGVGIGLTTENLVGFNRNFPILPVAGGEWHHLALVYDGTNAVVYLNGARVDPNVVNRKAIAKRQDPLLIGAQFDGALDEIRIYGRALVDDEIRSLRKDEPGRPVATCLRPVATEAAEADAGKNAINRTQRENAQLEMLACQVLDRWVDMYRRDEKDALGEAFTRTSRRTLMWDTLVQLADPAVALTDDKISIADDGTQSTPCTDAIMNILRIWKTGERFFALEEVKKLADKKTTWEQGK